MKLKFKRRIICAVATVFYIAGSLFSTGVIADINDLDSYKAKISQKISLSASAFTDTPKNAWYYSYVDHLVKNGVINGTSKTTFSPQSTFSLAESCIVITRYLGLEDLANDYKNTLCSDKTNYWYSGYIILMVKMGILNPNGICEYDANGKFEISDSAATCPIQRYLFCDMIAKSFELDKSDIKAKDSYYELSNLGHNFIATGSYDMDIVNSYANVINDFELIPAAFSQSVLKCYYNGIISGDDEGNFNPLSNLSRAEMSKVLATIDNFKFRSFAQNQNSIFKSLVSSDFVTTKTGDTYITKETANKVLTNEAQNITMSGGDLYFAPTNTAPIGYAIDVYIYSIGADGVPRLTGSRTLNTNDSQNQKPLFCWVGNKGRALLVLRNLSENLRVEGVIEANLERDSGVTGYDYCTSTPVSPKTAL